LINCSVLAEGADVPNIDCVMIARPTKSRNLFAQMIGRGLRLSPETEKRNCQILDFVESRTSVSDIVSTPTLLGLPASVLEGESSPSDIHFDREKPPDVTSPGPELPSTGAQCPTSITYIDYEDPFCLVDGLSVTPRLRQFSSLAWVSCGGDIYVLECLNTGFIRIETVSTDSGIMFVSHFTSTVSGLEKNLSFTRKKKILAAESLGAAVRGSDTYLLRKMGAKNLSSQLRWDARWRSLPASDAQKSFLLKRFNSNKQILKTNGFETTHLTKGQAANIITRLRHGAQGRYASRVRDIEKCRHAEQAAQDRSDKQTVRVGPLPAKTSQSKVLPA